MKYIKSDIEETDILLIETEGNEVVGVTSLVEHIEAPTPEELQEMLGLYMEGSGRTIEDALGAWVGGYSSIREAGDEDE